MDVMQLRRNLLMQQTSLLPNEYQQVEYLQSGANATEYIRTGIYPQYGDSLTAKFLSPNVASQGTDEFRPFGGYTLGVAVDGYYGLRGFGSSGANIVTNYRVNITDGNSHILDIGTDGKWVCDGIDIFTNKYIDSCTVDISLFKNHYINNVFYGTWAVRFYSFKYFRDGSCIRDFVPCYRKADSKPGMYDLVNKEFYINAGTGEFIIPT